MVSRTVNICISVASWKRGGGGRELEGGGGNTMYIHVPNNWFLLLTNACSSSLLYLHVGTCIEHFKE